MPRIIIVDILTFISKINTTSEKLKAIKVANRPQGYKKNHFQTKVLYFISLINVKMPRIKIVGFLIFISKINTTSESLKARKVIIFQHFSFYEQLKFHAELRMKNVL